MPKSKKAKKSADSHETPEHVENQDVNGEAAPPTIVEAGMEEVFQAQAEGTQEVGTEPTVEKPASKPRASKRPYIADVEILLNAGTHTKPQILALIMEKYPQVSKGGASTFLTDLMNEKYRHWKQRPVTKTPDGKLIFADRLEAPEPEAQTTDEPPDSPAE